MEPGTKLGFRRMSAGEKMRVILETFVQPSHKASPEWHEVQTPAGKFADTGESTCGSPFQVAEPSPASEE